MIRHDIPPSIIVERAHLRINEININPLSKPDFLVLTPQLQGGKQGQTQE
jgi:hypothetical protein